MRRRAYERAQSFAGMCMSVSASMVAFKVGLGIFSGSHALMANALYSINDLLSSIAVTVSLRIGARKPDDDHPYGFGKAEFIAAAMVSLVIAIGVIFMFFFSVIDILQGVPGPPHATAMALAALSMVVSWYISRRGHHLAGELGSPVLRTTAEHHHADAEGSLLAIVGIGGAVLGFHTLDRVIAVIETVHLIAIAGKLLGSSVRGLLDAAMPEEDEDLVREACGQIKGVESVAHVWSRQAGSNTWVDVAVAVPPRMDLRAAHDVCEEVKHAIHGVLGRSVVAQVRFQSPDHEYVMPPAGGGH